MGASNKAAAARSAATGAWSNPYVRRVVEDPELRENVRVAFESARSAYSRLANGKAATKVLLDDKKFQKELKDAADALRDAGMALREGPKKKRRRDENDEDDDRPRKKKKKKKDEGPNVVMLAILGNYLVGQISLVLIALLIAGVVLLAFKKG